MKRVHWMLALGVLMGCLIAGCPTDDPVFGIEVGTAPRPDDIPPIPDTKLDSGPLQEIDTAEPPDSQDTVRPRDTVHLEDADVVCRSDDECLAELGPLLPG